MVRPEQRKSRRRGARLASNGMSTAEFAQDPRRLIIINIPGRFP